MHTLFKAGAELGLRHSLFSVTKFISPLNRSLSSEMFVSASKTSFLNVHNCFSDNTTCFSGYFSLPFAMGISFHFIPLAFLHKLFCTDTQHPNTFSPRDATFLPLCPMMGFMPLWGGQHSIAMLTICCSTLQLFQLYLRLQLLLGPYVGGALIEFKQYIAFSLNLLVP